MIVEKVPTKFICTFCHYNTSRKSQFNRHLLTAKHKWNLNDSKNVPKEMNNICSCGKIYKFDTGYYRHKKKCIDQCQIVGICIDKDMDIDKEESQKLKDEGSG